MKAVLRGSNSHRSTRILVLSALVVKSPLARSSDRLGPDSSGKPIRSSHARVPAGRRTLRAWHHHLTSNKSYRDSNSNLGDPIIATAILDRLLRHLATINIRRESYRLKDRRKVGVSAGGKGQGAIGSLSFRRELAQGSSPSKLCYAAKNQRGLGQRRAPR